MRRGKRPADTSSSDGSMPVTGHLRELRNRILICALFLFIGFILCFHYAPHLIQYLTDMGRQHHYVFVYIAPQELLLVYLNTALAGALILCFPILAYEVYAFCSPGLTRKERGTVLTALIAGTLFFLLGVTFARTISLPFMLQFLIQFTGEVDVSASISIQEYIGFLLTVFVIFGLVFELPVITVTLTMLRIIRAEWLIRSRKVVIVAIFLLAAIITPPDVVSQILVAVPMIALYELSILLCRLIGHKQEERFSQVEESE